MSHESTPQNFKPDSFGTSAGITDLLGSSEQLSSFEVGNGTEFPEDRTSFHSEDSRAHNLLTSKDDDNKLELAFYLNRQLRNYLILD